MKLSHQSKSTAPLIKGLFLSALLIGTSQAATLVTYSFDSSGDGTNAQPLFVTGGVATDLGAQTFNISANPGGGYADNVLQIANGSFTITLTQLQTYSLNNITFGAAKGGSTGGDRGITVTSNVTGATVLFTDNDIDSERSTLTPYTVNLATLTEFDDIAGDITFTFTANTANGRSIELNDIVFNGTVPEPSSALLIGLAGLGFIARRRR